MMQTSSAGQAAADQGSYETPARIDNAPGFIKGAVKLRGAIVPVVDMRIKVNLGQAACDQFTVLVIPNIGGRVAGMVADSVSDATTLSPEPINSPPDMAT